MGILQDWLQSREAERVRQHLQFLEGAAAKGRQGDVGAVLGATPGATLGALKMPLDVAGLVGEDLAGHIVGNAAGAISPDAPENRAIQMAYALGGPGAAFDQATHDPSRAVSWATGGLGLVADPSFAANLVLPELAAAENAPRAVKIADLLTGGVLDKGAEIATGVAKQAVSPLVRQVIGNAGAKAAPKAAAKVATKVEDKVAPQAQQLLAPVEKRDPAALGGLGERLQLLQATYGPQWRQRLANLTGGLDYLDKDGNLIGPAGDATGVLDEYLSARPTLELAGDQAGKRGIKDRLRAAVWGDLTDPASRAAYRDQARKDVFGLAPPDVLQRIAQQINATPFRSGATLGALGGGLGAQDQNGDGEVDPGELLRSVAEGALVGTAAGGATKVPVGTLKDVAKIGHGAGVENFKVALKEGKTSRAALAGDWAADKVVTPRNALMDEISGRARALLAGLPMDTINGTVKSLVDRTKATGKIAKIDQELEDILVATGRDPVEFADNANSRFGQGFLDETLTSKNKAGKREQLHPLASAGAGAAYGMLDASNLAVPGAGVAFGALRGLLRPYTSEGFHAINDLQHMGLRNAAYKVEARRLLGDLGGQMIDDLKSRGFRTGGLDQRGLFSPTDLVSIGATKGAATWQAVLDQVFGVGDQRGLAGKFVTDTFGDYSKRSGLTNAIGKVAPFSRYTLGQIPVLAKLAAENPAVALMVANVIARTGSKLPVPTDTPLAGGLVQEELGGAPGEGSVSPLSLVAPVPPSAGDTGRKLDQAENVYQQAQALMGALGFDFNPLIKTGAYALGADPFGPGTQSRFAGIEQAMGGPEVPTIKGALDNARKAIAPIDKYGASTDPVETRLNEIVLRTTGKPLADPSNHKLAVALEQDPEHPLRQQAREEVLHGGAARSAASGVLPLTVSAKTDVKAAKDQATAGMPYTADQIKEAKKVSPTAAKQMQAAVDRYKAQHPAAAVNDRPQLSAREKQDPRLTEWENKNAALKMVNPSVYAAARKEFMQTMGIN